MEPTESALIVPVPEAQPVVGDLRAALDRSAGWGVPPHVTVLYPFLPTDRIDQRVLDTLAAAVRTVPAFDVTFARTSRFGDSVLWLAPEPDQPFRALTGAIWAHFPEHPPYRGEYADVVPHLTVGHDAPVDVLRGAADAIAPRLPIRAHVTAVHLLCGPSERASWRPVADFALGAA